MGKTFKDQVAKMNSDLRRDLAEMDVKYRITFHRSTEAHGKAGRAKNRHDRRSSKQALRRGDW